MVGDDLKAVLQELQTLLYRFGYEPQAQYLGNQLDRLRREPEFSYAELASAEIWGGNGSVNDAAFNSPEADRRFSELLVKLSEILVAHGIRNTSMDFVATTRRNWLDADIWTKLEIPSPAPTVLKSRGKDSLKRKQSRGTA